LTEAERHFHKVRDHRGMKMLSAALSNQPQQALPQLPDSRNCPVQPPSTFNSQKDIAPTTPVDPCVSAQRRTSTAEASSPLRPGDLA
jgi:hypothetical protein